LPMGVVTLRPLVLRVDNRAERGLIGIEHETL
jgi:hypothetical protein